MNKRDLNEVRRLAYEAGRKMNERDRAKAFSRGERAFRDRATNALCEAGFPPEVYGLVAALEIEGDTDPEALTIPPHAILLEKM